MLKMHGRLVFLQGGGEVLRIEGTGIQLTRGDTTRFTAVLSGRELPKGSEALFTVKAKAWRHEEIALQKRVPVLDGKAHVFLEKEETMLEPGHYVWDLRVTEPYDDGENRFTPMAYGGLDVLEAIGDE